jgi:hypothetical protein
VYVIDRHCTAILRVGRFIVDSVYWASCTKKKPGRLERGGPCCTAVETQVNSDSRSTNEKGPSLVGSLGFPCRYKRFFPHCTLFSSIVPIAQQAGQAVVLGRLSLIMCL